MGPSWLKQQLNSPYEPSESEDSETLLEKQELMAHESLRRSNPRSISGWMLVVTVLNILVLGATTFIVGVPFIASRRAVFNAAVRETSWYSKCKAVTISKASLTVELAPVFDSLEIKHHEIQINGTVWPDEFPAPARMAPGPEADAWWQGQFDPIWAIPLTRAEVEGLGKDPEYVAKFEDDFWGFGDDAYIGALDVTHQMHCLNAIREYAFADYGEGKSPTKKQHDSMQWLHLRHCVDIIAQNIMCHADAGLHTYFWMDTQRQPFPDFSVNRKCRDWNALMAWRDERTVDMEKYGRMVKPKGVKQRPAEPGFYEKFGFEGSDLFPELAHQAVLDREKKEKASEEKQV